MYRPAAALPDGTGSTDCEGGSVLHDCHLWVEAAPGITDPTASRLSAIQTGRECWIEANCHEGALIKTREPYELGA